MTTLQRFTVFLNMSERNLITAINLYNAGKLSPRSREALEAIEAMYDSDQKL